MLILIIIVVLFNVIAIFIPKRLTGIEIAATSLFAMYLQVNADVFLDLKYHLYGYFQKGPDFRSLIYLLGIYPAVNIVYLNYFPYKKKVINKLIYLLAWEVVACVMECIFLWTKTYYYNNWKLAYSLLMYPSIYLTLNCFHKYIIYLLKKIDPNRKFL
ncbi:CBO0543 family protein [Bacillus sp. EB600]|uniref:CBO0543 family protein n=1 Tax=Bacillus sp. EB600 TaxID=2806345 RepID=UPI002108C963|nr:CBO0543 family protein [Bacillus sp. EB600]MCQ6280085.1 hypothetical protein [Bacillus sp. EB600]